MADDKFTRAERGKYILEEQNALRKLCEKCKLAYDEKLNGTFGKQLTMNRGRSTKISTSG